MRSARGSEAAAAAAAAANLAAGGAGAASAGASAASSARHLVGSAAERCRGRKASWRLGSCLLVGLALPAAGQQSESFSVLQYREPGQCERMQCLSGRVEFCREHLEGFYLKEQGCKGNQICTDCQYGNSTYPTKCRCENPPYSVPALYNQECNTGKICADGQGICFRPCGTYLHVTQCPPSYCKWDTLTRSCVSKPADTAQVMWPDMPDEVTPFEQGEGVVTQTPVSMFPMAYEAFTAGAVGYRIRGILLQDLSPLQNVFLQLDEDFDGSLSASEYAVLPDVLGALDSVAAQVLADRAAALRASLMANATESDSRRLQATASPEACSRQRPQRYFCSFDASCKLDCRECGWKSATDAAYSTCVQPTPEACYADGGKVYCPSDQLCHPNGDCSGCIDRPIVDHEQHTCLALWWDKQPLTQWTNWVCRPRNKVGMPCRSDQDCVFGLRRCLQSQCQPFQPYNANQTCVEDYDCPHLNYYCPPDPTGGENPYWVQYCRRQRDEGVRCVEDRECGPQLRCNDAEPLPRCRRLFSLPIGTPAKADILCSSGWRDRQGKCAPSARSKQAGRSCDTDDDCTTTDQTGRTGRCVCKAWWDRKDARYCEPVAGDYSNHQEKLRNYLWFRATNCGFFWTEEECLAVFGEHALRLKLEVECETQQLSGGPYLPPSECNIRDNDRFPDPCGRLAALR